MPKRHFLEVTKILPNTSMFLVNFRRKVLVFKGYPINANKGGIFSLLFGLMEGMAQLMPSNPKCTSGKFDECNLLSDDDLFSHHI